MFFLPLCECVLAGGGSRVRVGVGGDAPWCGGVPGVNYIPHLSIKQQSLESFLCTHKMVSVHLL